MKYKTYVSPYTEEMDRSNLPKEVRIFDTTLRDGEQTPGVSFTSEEKIHIAGQLDKLGVAIIEAGFPIASQSEKDNVKNIANLGLKAQICGLSRVIEKDIDACIDAEVDLIHTFVATSDIHLEHQMGKTREEMHKAAVKAVEYIKDHGFKCMFSPMDASRSDFDYLIGVLKDVEAAGADIINIPDTVGVIAPPAMNMFISRIREQISIPLDMHCHNDFGLAVANSLAGVEAGASGIQVSVNGLGERAGNADLEQVVMALECLYRVPTGIKTEFLTETSKLIERFAQFTMPPNFPLVGRNAFTHESGIHTHAVLKKAYTFEPITPEMVGQRSRVVMGKHTGRHAVRHELEQNGYKANDKQVQEITDKIKALTEKQKNITEDDFIAIAEDIISNSPTREMPIQIEEITVTTGSNMTSTATAIVKVFGVQKVLGGIGVGAVDAACNAIKRAVDVPITLKDYSLKANTGGTNALADVLIRVEDQYKNTYEARALHEDIVIASVNAIVNGMNKVLLNQEKNKIKEIQ